MTSKTVRRDQDIDFEAIARWNNEGGAPGPLKRGANRFRLYDAVEFEVHSNCGHNGIPLIPMRGVDLNQHCATLVQKDTAFHWPVTNTEADKRVWRHRKQQLGNRVADTPASTSHDDSEKELVTPAFACRNRDVKTPSYPGIIRFRPCGGLVEFLTPIGVGHKAA
jgi:hypothetical protein